MDKLHSSDLALKSREELRRSLCALLGCSGSYFFHLSKIDLMRLISCIRERDLRLVLNAGCVREV